MSPLERVQGLINSDGPDHQRFTPGPRLSESAIAAWESEKGIQLPDEYRLFFLGVGNGGSIPGSYCDFRLKALEATVIESDLKLPFPVTRHRFDERISVLKVEGRWKIPFLELAAFEGGLPPGCLGIGVYPGGDFLFLVVTGELSGQVWCLVNHGTPELERATLRPFSFLERLEDTLLEAKSWN